MLKKAENAVLKFGYPIGNRRTFLSWGQPCPDPTAKTKKNMRAGKLRIADHWNAINIIANSQANPLKAVAEFLENSIDARAKRIIIMRGKKKGKFYLELYLSDPGSANRVGLYRRGMRVLPSITEIDHFQKEPWIAGYLQGIVDAPFLTLTPGTRHGIIRDDHFDIFCRAMDPVENHLNQIIEEQRKAEEERSSRQVLRRVQHALKEAFLRLPQEEYDWFDIHSEKSQKKPGGLFSSGSSCPCTQKNI